MQRPPQENAARNCPAGLCSAPASRKNSAFPSDPEYASQLGRIGIPRDLSRLLRIAQTHGDPILPIRQNRAEGIAKAGRKRLDILAEISDDTPASEIVAPHPVLCIVHECGKPLQRSTGVGQEVAIQLAVEIAGIGRKHAQSERFLAWEQAIERALRNTRAPQKPVQARCDISLLGQNLDACFYKRPAQVLKHRLRARRTTTSATLLVLGCRRGGHGIFLDRSSRSARASVDPFANTEELNIFR